MQEDGIRFQYGNQDLNSYTGQQCNKVGSIPVS